MEPVALKDLPGLTGQEIGVSDWLEITQDRVNRFADATGDHQWIHVDVERATQAIGGTIAHGYLILSLIPHLSQGMLNLTGVAYGLNYGTDKVRFTQIVRVGKRVRLRQRLLGVEPKGIGVLVKIENTVEVEGEPKPGCVAETLALLYGTP